MHTALKNLSTRRPSRPAALLTILILFNWTLITPAFAFFCPKNFIQINFGDSIEHVAKVCGKPDQVKKKEVKPPEPQEWTYYLTQTLPATTSNSTQGTLKTSISFDKEGKAVNINVNGIGIGASTICGSNIQLGDTIETIRSACGKPDFTFKQTPENGQGEEKKKKIITEYLYNSNPPITLIFENDKLVKKK